MSVLIGGKPVRDCERTTASAWLQITRTATETEVTAKQSQCIS